MTSKSCCDKAINEGTLIRKGRAEWVCPTCGKDQMLKLVLMADAGINYVPGKGLKTKKEEKNETSKNQNT